MAHLSAQILVRPSLFFALCFLGATTLQAASVSGDVSNDNLGAPPSTVVVWGALGDQDADNRTLDALRAQLSDLRVDLKTIGDIRPQGQLIEQIAVSKTIASRENALLVVWIDASRDDDEFILFIAHPASDRLLVREISTKGRNPEGLSETIAVIVRASAKAVIHGHEIGFDQPARALKGIETAPRATAKSPEQSPPAIPDQIPTAEQMKNPQTAHFGLSLGYGVFLTTRDADPFHGPAGRVHLRVETIDAFVGYQHRLSQKAGNRSVDLELSSGRMCAGVLAGVDLGREWRIEGGIEGGLTFITADSKSRSESLTAASPQLRWVFGIAPKLALSRRIYDRLDAYAAISVDVLLKDIEYVTVTSSGNERVLGFWRFQPFFEIGLIFFDFIRPSFVQDAR